MNFALDVVESAPPESPAMIALGRDGTRTEISFGEVADRSARLAGTLAARGVGRGDVVMTVVGNRPEWVYAMVACFRMGAVVLPCTEQLRPKDLLERIERADPRAVIVDERDLRAGEATGFAGELLVVPDERLFDGEPLPPADLAASD